MEQSCLEFHELFKEFKAAPRYSNQGIVILRKIKEVQARIAELQHRSGGPGVISSISASAEDEQARKPFLAAVSWRGVKVEARFLWAALDHDLGVALPYGAPYRWDLIVTTRTRSYRVQVKYTTFPASAGWVLSLQRHDGSGYDENDFDLLAALAPDGTWYIIPMSEIKGRRAISLPRREQKVKNKPMPWAQYRERWDLFA